MKKLILIIGIAIGVSTSVWARDFMIEFEEENYKETKVQFSYQPLIYHSIQVNSEAGPKVLVLEGDDSHYRKWIRHYIADNRRFILKVDPETADRFISSKVFKTDIRALHPLADNDWPDKTMEPSPVGTLKGDNYFLVIDTNETRTHLLSTISKKMGYQSIAFKSGEAGLKTLKLQPEKFKMIVIYPDISDINTDSLVKKLVSIKHNVPIVVETGYKNNARKMDFTSQFARFRSVHIKSVILNDFQTTIKKLVNSNA